MSKRRTKSDCDSQFKKKKQRHQQTTTFDNKIAESWLLENATTFGTACFQFYLTLLKKQISFFMTPQFKSPFERNSKVNELEPFYSTKHIDTGYASKQIASIKPKQKITLQNTIDISDDSSGCDTETFDIETTDSATVLDEKITLDKPTKQTDVSDKHFSETSDDQFSDMEPPYIPLRLKSGCSPTKTFTAETNQIHNEKNPSIATAKHITILMKIVSCGTCLEQKFGTQLGCCQKNICKLCIAKLPITITKECNQITQEPEIKVIQCPFCFLFFPYACLPSSFRITK